MDKQNKVAKKHWNDLILLAALLVVGAILFMVISMTAQKGGDVNVVVDGKTVAEYPLDEDREVALEYRGYNLLVIKDGKASIEDADCPDKLCVEQRAVSKDGETIICLPHKTVIKVSGGDESEFDGVIE